MQHGIAASASKQERSHSSGIILLVFLILLISGFVIFRAVFSAQDEIRTADDDLSEESAEALRTLSETIEDIQIILEHSERYPASLLQLLAGNLETLEFVKNYPDHGSDTPADSIGSVTAGEIPLLLQWDERWGYAAYGSDFLAITGCGPTCLSMVAAGLTGDGSITPVTVAEAAEQGGHYAEGYGSSWTLMSQCSAEFGLTATELPLDEATMLRELEAGHPIICSMNPGDFTASGHYIVLVSAEHGQFRVHDPNSRERSDRLWDYDTLSGQIGNLWAFSLT